MANPRLGMFLPTTPIFDVGTLEDPKQQRELIIRLTQKINDIIVALNLKDTGYYVQEPFCCSQKYFPNPNQTDLTPLIPIFRQTLRQVFLFPQLPNSGTIVIAHNIPITNIYSFTRIYGVANDQTGLNFTPIPSTTTTGNIIFIGVDAVNIFISTNFDATNYNMAYGIIEWLGS